MLPVYSHIHVCVPYFNKKKLENSQGGLKNSCSLLEFVHYWLTEHGTCHVAWSQPQPVKENKPKN